MPLATITDWSFGPMGPGWFLLHPSSRNVFYDGATPLEEEKKPDFERDVEALALVLLMGDRCR